MDGNITGRRPDRPDAVVSLWVGEGHVEQSLAAINAVAAAVRRSLLALLIWIGICAGLAVACVALTTPDYIASVQLVLEQGRQTPDGPDAGPSVEQIALDDQQVQTQLHLIKSDSVLRLAFDAMTEAGSPDILRRFHGPAAREEAFQAFQARVSARRLGLSDVVDIAYRAPDPRQAARVANAIAAAYIRDRVRSAVEDAQVGTPYLKSRIDAILTEAMLVAGNVRVGMVPGAYLPDADVRILGPAIEPLGPAYPKLGPILVFAVGFGAISGLVTVAFFQQAAGTIRSRQHFRNRFAIACIETALDGEIVSADASLRALARTVGRASEADGSATTPVVGAVRHPAIGLVAWTDDPACRAIAAAMTALLTAAGPPAVLIDLDRAGQALRPGSSRVPGLTRLAAHLRLRARPTVLALPALAGSFKAQALAPLLDAMILVVAAHRTTVADVEAAQRAFRTVGVCIAAVIVTAQSRRPDGRRRVGRQLGRVFRRHAILFARRDVA